MFSKIILAVWSGMGLLWWVLAWWLVAADQRKEPVSVEWPRKLSLSIFKPLPPLGAKGLASFAAGLESFISQLEAESELLLGIHEADRDLTAPFVGRMQKAYPRARLQVIYRSEPDGVANPKIAWQKVLARHAEGDLWLWSDADIVASPDFLRAARDEYERSGEAMMTFPYGVREIPSSPALFDALFVNVDFFPGVLLLRRMGPVDFGFGAAMLFRRDDFLRKVDWAELGASLADDFILGQRLGPVRIGTSTLATVADAATWKEALSHDLRWNKTIRWNRPAGFAARVLILPILGWLGWALLHPTHLLPWLGLVIMMQIDIFFASIICRRSGCHLGWRHLPTLELWSIWRSIVWLACWLPWPVVWSGRTWWRSRWT